MNKNLLITALIIILFMCGYFFIQRTKSDNNVLTTKSSITSESLPVGGEKQNVSISNTNKEKPSLLKNEAYVFGKVYKYESLGTKTEVTFLGYELCPQGVGVSGNCPKFIITNDGTVWGMGELAFKLKNDASKLSLDVLNKKYEIIEKSSNLLKLKKDQNMFEMINIYQKTGLFEFIEPNWIMQGQVV